MCCDSIVIDDRLLKSRGAGIYHRAGNVNDKPYYIQDQGSTRESANFIYFNGDHYVIGERRESSNILYAADGGKRTFMRTFNDEVTRDDGSSIYMSKITPAKINLLGPQSCSHGD